MKKIMPRSAGVLIAIGFFVLVNILYAALGTVDLVFVKDGEVLCRQDNVNSLSVIMDPLQNMDDEAYEENSDIVFTYTLLGEEHVFGEDMFILRAKMAARVIRNLYTFRWSESSEEIVLTANE